MSQPFIRLIVLERKLASGETESLEFETGVNLLIGRSNTGKTKWLETFDYLLGDESDFPLEEIEEGAPGKYISAAAHLQIGDEKSLHIERRWRERGAKTKIFVDGNGMNSKEFQQMLLQRLGIPLLNYPKGNPMSGQTWPELSFRQLLRHIYRQQLKWGDLAEKQPISDQHACILQFLGACRRNISRA